MDEQTTLPRDEFSVRLRELAGHPGAVKSSSRIDRQDFYGNLETWTIDTFRAPAGSKLDAAPNIEIAFVQKVTSSGSLRLMLPAEVMATLTRHRASATRQNRRRGARQAVQTKRAAGTAVGNPDALKRARKAPKRPKTRKRGGLAPGQSVRGGGD